MHHFSLALLTNRLHRFALLTATVLVSLTAIPLTETNLGMVSASAQAQTTQERNAKAKRLYQVGVHQYKQSQFREALETFQQVLVIFGEIGERKGEGATLDYIGSVYRNLGQYPKALEFYTQALAIHKQIGNKTGEGTTLTGIGAVYRNLGQYPKALEFYTQALAIHKQIGNKTGEGTTLTGIGAVYYNLGQYPKALEFDQQALAIHKQIGDKAMEGATLNNIGLVYYNLGQYPKALEFDQQALAIHKQIGNKAEEGTTLNNIGLVYYNLGQYPKALEFYTQALAIYKQIGNKAAEAMILRNIGSVYYNLGQYPKALEFYTQALAIHKQIDNKAEEGTTLTGIASVYDKLGQYPKALEFYTQALAIHKQIGNKAHEGTTLNNTGSVYDKLGQYPKALEFYTQALAITKQIGDKAGEGTILNNIGSVYNNLGQYPKALEFYTQALAIAKQIGNKAHEGTTLNNIGLVYNNLGQYPKALEFYTQALAITKQIGNKAHEGTTLNNIGFVYNNLGQYPKALEFYTQALAIAKQIGNKAQEGTTLNNIGLVYNNLGQYSKAEKMLFAAIEVSESVRPGLKDDQKISIFETQANAYRFLQQALVAQNKNHTALEIAERGRARAFVELLASKRSPNPNIQQIKPPTPPNIKQIQQIAQQQKATLVEYSMIYAPFQVQGKEEWHPQLYIWVVKPTGEVAFKQVDIKSLDTPLADLVAKSHTSIRARSGDVAAVPGEASAKPRQKKPLQQLHQILIQPIASELPQDSNARIIFIPQAELFFVPFPALQDASGKYLIEKHTILTAPAIQVLELTRQQKINKRKAIENRPALVVGNPTMPQQLSPLPGAEQEALEIAKMLNTKALTGSKATETTVKQLMQSVDIVHLATHGLLDDFKGLGVPGAIALAPSGQDDGLLTSGEIFDMKLDADLVVLSACDTGRGDIKSDGVIGLSRSLITAGAPSIIVSLWAVSDDSTAMLMTEFYQNLRRNPDKAVALRNAMLSTMKKHYHPRDWAAFTLIGEAE